MALGTAFAKAARIPVLCRNLLYVATKSKVQLRETAAQIFSPLRKYSGLPYSTNDHPAPLRQGMQSCSVALMANARNKPAHIAGDQIPDFSRVIHTHMHEIHRENNVQLGTKDIPGDECSQFLVREAADQNHRRRGQCQRMSRTVLVFFLAR